MTSRLRFAAEEHGLADACRDGHARRSVGDRHGACVLGAGRQRPFAVAAEILQRQNVRADASGDLPGQRVIALREDTTVKRPLQFGDPSDMEGVERPGGDAGPVVNRHGGHRRVSPRIMLPPDRVPWTDERGRRVSSASRGMWYDELSVGFTVSRREW